MMIRVLKSGILGILNDQIARIHVVNTGPPTSIAKSVWVQGFKNPRSEPLIQETFFLESGASVYLDVKGDIFETSDEKRLQIRASVTILDDVDSSCLATLEVIDRSSGRSAVLINLAEAGVNLVSEAMSGYDKMEQNIGVQYQKLMESQRNSKREIEDQIESLERQIAKLKEQIEKLEKLFAEMNSLASKRTGHVGSEKPDQPLFAEDRGEWKFMLKELRRELKKSGKMIKAKLRESKKHELGPEDLRTLIDNISKGGSGGIALAYYIMTQIAERSSTRHHKEDTHCDEDNSNLIGSQREDCHDIDQMESLSLQEQMQKTNIIIAMISNISKMFNDTMKAIISNVK